MPPVCIPLNPARSCQPYGSHTTQAQFPRLSRRNLNTMSSFRVPRKGYRAAAFRPRKIGSGRAAPQSRGQGNEIENTRRPIMFCGSTSGVSWAPPAWITPPWIIRAAAATLTPTVRRVLLRLNSRIAAS